MKPIDSTTSEKPTFLISETQLLGAIANAVITTSDSFKSLTDVLIDFRPKIRALFIGNQFGVCEVSFFYVKGLSEMFEESTRYTDVYSKWTASSEKIIRKALVICYHEYLSNQKQINPNVQHEEDKTEKTSETTTN